jgi:YHYH protein/Secretion system C-terminal sorting domain
MKKLILIAFMIGIVSSATTAQSTQVIQAWLRNTTNATGYNGFTANVQSVYYTSTDVYVSATSIPAYTIGPWTANPNTPNSQNFIAKFTRTPSASGVTYTGLGAVGLWTNGVSIYNPKDGMRWNSATGAFVGGVTTNGWNRNALVFEGISFDACLGHAAGAATNYNYHHHVTPKCLYDQTATTVHSPIIGYAFDGYPIYGAYGYTNTNGTGGIKRMVSSYALPTTQPASRLNGPSFTYVSSGKTCVLGSMCEDFIYTPSTGDLDEYNGRTCVTPEYPGGTYAYFVTIDAAGNPAYPFIMGPTYKGVAVTGTNQTIPAGATFYTGAALPVELLGFTVQLKNKNNVFANWRVGSEINVSDYQIERSIDAQSFDLVGIIPAQQRSSYDFLDKSLDNGNYYYRVKTVDNDGSFSYSPIASLSVKNDQSILIHNNPAHDVLIVQSNDALVERSIELYTLDGKLLDKKSLEQGMTMCSFDVQMLYAGTYLVRISDGQVFKSIKVVVNH